MKISWLGIRVNENAWNWQRCQWDFEFKPLFQLKCSNLFKYLWFSYKVSVRCRWNTFFFQKNVPDCWSRNVSERWLIHWISIWNAIWQYIIISMPNASNFYPMTFNLVLSSLIWCDGNASRSFWNKIWFSIRNVQPKRQSFGSNCV